MPGVLWKHFGLRILPALLLLLMLLVASRLPIPFTEFVIPVLPAFAALYYWTLFRPSSLPLLVIAAIAMLHDVLYGLPFGISLFCFLLVRVMTLFLQKRLIMHQFLVAWFGFLIIILLVLVAIASLCSIVESVDWPDKALMLLPAMALSWLSYPIFHLLFNYCYTKLSRLPLRDQSLI